MNRFYVLNDSEAGMREQKRYYLRAKTLRDALEEARGLEAAEVGQSVDLYREGVEGEVAVMVDVRG